MRLMCSTFSIYVSAILVFMALIPQMASSNAIGDADRDLFLYIHEDMNNSFLDSVLPAIQRMGDPPVYLGICTLLCAFGNEKMAETGKLAAAAFLESGFIVFALKQIINRPRPLDELAEVSFPSGHSALAFALATVVGYEYPKIRIPLYITASATAFSRVYLGRHYPSDVIFGALIGTLVGLQMIHYRKPVLSFSF